jgi:hypothetical protein
MSGAAFEETQGSNIAGAATTDIGAATGNFVQITGTSGTITSLGNAQAGARRIVYFVSAGLVLTHNISTLVLPGQANITVASGDVAVFVSIGTNAWRCVSYTKLAGTPVVMPTGSIVGRSYSTHSTYGSVSTIPWDDTIPQSSEGTSIFAVSYTPSSSSNRLRVRFHGFVSGDGTAGTVTAALFAGTGTVAANAVQSSGVRIDTADQIWPLALEYEYAPGTASAQAIELRVGSNAATGYIHGNSGGRKYGGAGSATLVIEEIKG